MAKTRKSSKHKQQVSVGRSLVADRRTKTAPKGWFGSKWEMAEL
jgi:hypothetical protein